MCESEDATALCKWLREALVYFGGTPEHVLFDKLSSRFRDDAISASGATVTVFAIQLTAGAGERSPPYSVLRASRFSITAFRLN